MIAQRGNQPGKMFEQESGFFGIGGAGAFRFFIEAAAGGVYKSKRGVGGKQQMPCHGSMCFQLIFIEDTGRISHNGGVHAVLFFQQSNRFGVKGCALFEQGGGKAVARGFVRFDRGRQLAMIACQHQLLRFEDRYPAGGLQGLAGLIYHYGMILLVPHGIMIGAYQGGGNHLRLGDDVVDDILFGVACFFDDLTGFVEQGFPLFPFRFAEVALVFVRHIPELVGLFFQALDLLHTAVLRHFTVQGER